MGHFRSFQTSTQFLQKIEKLTIYYPAQGLELLAFLTQVSCHNP